MRRRCAAVSRSRQTRALIGVVRHDPRVVALLGIEALRLSLGTARARLGEADQGVAGGDHGDSAARRPAEDRDHHLGAARVVGSDHTEDARVGGVCRGVRPAPRLGPEAGLGARVVAGLEADGLPSRPPVGFFEHDADRIVHLPGALARITLEGEVGDDQRFRCALPAVLDCTAGRRLDGRRGRPGRLAEAADREIPPRPAERRRRPGLVAGRTGRSGYPTGKRLHDCCVFPCSGG